MKQSQVDLMILAALNRIFKFQALQEFGLRVKKMQGVFLEFHTLPNGIGSPP